MFYFYFKVLYSSIGAQRVLPLLKVHVAVFLAERLDVF